MNNNAIRLLLIWCCNALALLGVAYLLPGVRVDGFGSALIAAFVLGIFNLLIRPLLILFTFPVTVLTMGLFVLVINGLIFWLGGSILRGFDVSGFWVGVLGAILYSSIAYVLALLIPKDQTNQQSPPDSPITIDHDKL